MQPHLVLRGLRKTFGRTVAVDGLDLTVAPGEFVALLGPSGCGKTTTLRIVAGFERPDRGEVLIQGLPATDKPPHRRDVGIVFQSYALFPHMTVAENVAYGLRMRKVPPAERAARVAAALDLVRLSGLDARYPRQLSGGQQQRVAVARAIVIRPSACSSTSPCRTSTPAFARRCGTSCASSSGRCASPPSSSPTTRRRRSPWRTASWSCTRGASSRSGHRRRSTPSPASPFVAEFIGRCNFLSGRIHAPDGAAPVFRADEGLALPLPPGVAGSHGQRGMVALRPEAIALLGLDETPAPGAIVVEAVVRRVTYLGALRKYRVATGAGPELQVDCQVGPLATHAQALTEGAAVRVAWLPASCTFQPAVRPRAGGERGVTRPAWRPLLLLAPSLAVLVGVFAVPLGILGRYSFYRTEAGGVMVQAWVLDQYRASCSMPSTSASWGRPSRWRSR